MKSILEYDSLEDTPEPTDEELKEIAEEYGDLIGAIPQNNSMKCAYCGEMWVLPSSQDISGQEHSGCLYCVIEGNTLSDYHRALFATPPNVIVSDPTSGYWLKISQTTWIPVEISEDCIQPVNWAEHKHIN